MLTLTLGPVLFSDFELPEKIGNLGGVHLIAQHKFPGGTQTQQTFGGFPEPITWSGIFTGTSAMYRKNLIDRLRSTGQEVVLAYGDKMFAGVVEECRLEPKHQWLIPYTITFSPRVDLSAGESPSLLLDLFDLINGILADLNDLIAFFNLITANDRAFPMPPQLFGPAVTLFNVTNNAVISSLGQVVNIPPTDAAAIYAAATALLAAAAPLTIDPDPAVSSPAIDMSGYAGSIINIVQQGSTTQTTLQTINPNLPSLAAQFYGDATLWKQIAVASNINPPDPFPIGEFLLTIPNVSPVVAAT
jgi:hypothetical protein